MNALAKHDAGDYEYSDYDNCEDYNYEHAMLDDDYADNYDYDDDDMDGDFDSAMKLAGFGTNEDYGY